MKEFESVALLIDADNAQASKIESVLKDVSAYGRIVIKRAYGNWSKPHLSSWESKIKRFAISAIQQFDFATGKNASDMALTIDAMELLHTEKYDCFVLVSSDSDFTSLAIKLHESGVYVVGYGNKTTVESFRNACDEFNYVEELMEEEKSSEESEAEPETPAPETEGGKSKRSRTRKSAKKDPFKELDSLLKIAEERYADDTGFANSSSAGTYIKRVKPDFNIKLLGYSKLPEYLKDNPEKYVTEERAGKGTVKLIMYKSVQKQPKRRSSGSRSRSQKKTEPAEQ
ncbi:MAG: NYN domain-containing protein [Lachnospiraceae bacterium]|nr:NYN domain-containing protein [Lachnospiraceae bacterium]